MFNDPLNIPSRDLSANDGRMHASDTQAFNRLPPAGKPYTEYISTAEASDGSYKLTTTIRLGHYPKNDGSTRHSITMIRDITYSDGVTPAKSSAISLSMNGDTQSEIGALLSMSGQIGEFLLGNSQDRLTRFFLGET